MSFSGGGSDLLGLVKERIVRPDVIVSLRGLSNADQVTAAASGLTIGGEIDARRASAGMRSIKQQYAVLAEAAGSVATPQIRNVGTLAGNVAQRPWCWYFRNGFPCYKAGGNQCFSFAGENRVPRHLRRRAELHRASVGHGAGADGARRHLPGRRSGAASADSGAGFLRAAAAERAAGERPRQRRRHRVGAGARARSRARAARITRCSTAKPGRTRSSARPSCSRWISRSCRRASVVLGGVAPIPWRLPEVEKTADRSADHRGAGGAGRRAGGRRRAAAVEERLQDSADQEHGQADVGGTLGKSVNSPRRHEGHEESWTRA